MTKDEQNKQSAEPATAAVWGRWDQVRWASGVRQMNANTVHNAWQSVDCGDCRTSRGSLMAAIVTWFAGLHAV